MPILDTTYRSRLTNRFQAETFWAQYDFPFAYEVGIRGRKTELSTIDTDGLDIDAEQQVGYTPTTTLHLVVTEGFTSDDGNLAREAGDFMCFNEGDYPIRGLVRVDTDLDGNRHTYKPPVTCVTCLKRASRYRTNEAALVPTNAESHVYEAPTVPSPGGPVTAADGGPHADD